MANQSYLEVGYEVKLTKMRPPTRMQIISKTTESLKTGARSINVTEFVNQLQNAPDDVHQTDKASDDTAKTLTLSTDGLSLNMEIQDQGIVCRNIDGPEIFWFGKNRLTKLTETQALEPGAMFFVFNRMPTPHIKISDTTYHVTDIVFFCDALLEGRVRDFLMLSPSCLTVAAKIVKIINNPVCFIVRPIIVADIAGESITNIRLVKDEPSIPAEVTVCVPAALMGFKIRYANVEEGSLPDLLSLVTGQIGDIKERVSIRPGDIVKLSTSTSNDINDYQVLNLMRSLNMSKLSTRVLLSNNQTYFLKDLNVVRRVSDQPADNIIGRRLNAYGSVYQVCQVIEGGYIGELINNAHSQAWCFIKKEMVTRKRKLSESRSTDKSIDLTKILQAINDPATEIYEKPIATVDNRFTIARDLIVSCDETQAQSYIDLMLQQRRQINLAGGLRSLVQIASTLQPGETSDSRQKMARTMEDPPTYYS